MRVLAPSLALVWFLACAAPAVAQVAAGADSTTSTKGGFPLEEKKPLSREAESTLQQINAYRARGATCGSRTMEPAPPLEWSEVLQRAADVQARHMGRVSDVTHEGPDGSSVGTRVKREGYEWSSVGENAAAGRNAVSATLAQWMSSPGHCSNLMGAGFREVAVVGINAGGRYGSYWVMVLAAPSR